MTLILPILRLIPALRVSLRLSMVLTMNVFFLIFLRQRPKMTKRQMGPPRLPLPQYGRHRKQSSVHGRRNNLSRAVNSEFFYEKSRLQAFNDPFVEVDNEDAPWNVDTRPTYPKQALDPDLFCEIRRKVLPAKAENVAKVF